MVKINNISEIEYSNSGAECLFSYEGERSKFAEIRLDKKSYKFSWGSDLITPFIIEMNDDIFGVGIDFNFVAIKVSSEEVILSLTFDEFFKTVELLNGKAYIAADTKIVIFDMATCDVVDEVELPDLFDDFLKTEKGIEVICFDGSRVKLIS